MRSIMMPPGTQVYLPQTSIERSSPYRNVDEKHFADEAGAAGIGRVTYPYSGWKGVSSTSIWTAISIC